MITNRGGNILFTQPDPLGLAGGINIYLYAPNALGWMDPWGLVGNATDCSSKQKKRGLGLELYTNAYPQCGKGGAIQLLPMVKGTIINFDKVTILPEVAMVQNQRNDKSEIKLKAVFTVTDITAGKQLWPILRK